MGALKKHTFNSRDLCDRYDCSLRTIHAMERKKGFPTGDIFSKGLLWSVPKVIGWEKEHMPHLHSEIVVDEDPEQAAEWSQRARRRALDRDDDDEVEVEPEEQKPQRPKKAKRPRGRRR